MNKLLNLKYQLLRLLRIKAGDKTNADKLYDLAFSTIGKDASPLDTAPDEYGCADSVSTLLGQIIDFPDIVSTAELQNRLLSDERFLEISEPEKGCIIISATGTGNGTIKNGHTAIVGKNVSPDNSLWIMGNDSNTGIWSVSWTVNRWKSYFVDKGGFLMRYFRILG
jgi:hypothetical protein